MSVRQLSFPRSDNPGFPMVVTGELWNDLCDALEWCLRIGVMHPLMMQDANGPRLSIQRSVNQAVIQLNSPRAVWSTGVGAGRYNGCIGTGPITAVDPNSNFVPPDAAMTFPSSPNCIAVDVYEGGSSASGTCVITANSIVLGTFIGTDNETSPQLPVYYFSSAPSGTLFKVLLTPNSSTPGTQGTATTAATWAYDLFLFDGAGLQLGVNQQPDAPRPNGQVTQATIGWAYMTQTGTIWLAEAIEPPIVATCTPAAGVSSARGFAYMLAGN